VLFSCPSIRSAKLRKVPGRKKSEIAGREISCRVSGFAPLMARIVADRLKAIPSRKPEVERVVLTR